MCGIAGFYKKGNIEPMLDLVAHRGPDEIGSLQLNNVTIGCRRLKVIDLVSGRQPILNETRSLAIVYNGEIFNYRDLRTELIRLGHAFSTQTDTEVLLHGYEQWGEDVLRRLNGQFAFAITDGDKIFLARDRMGEKPLYYFCEKDQFAFSSEIKALLPLADASPAINEEFFVYDTRINGATAFGGIFELLPGHKAIFQNNKLKIEPYWQIATGEENVNRSEADLIEELRYLITDAVKIRTQADVPVGMFLSGGLDSALIAAIAKPEKAFSCSFPLGSEYDELRYAAIMADQLGIRHFTITPKAEDLRIRLANILWSMDQPPATASVLAEFMLAEEAAKQGVKVVLGGQGADELFCGYVRHLLMSIEFDFLNKLPELEHYKSLARYFWSKDAFTDPAARYFYLVARAVPNNAGPYIAAIKSIFDGCKTIEDAVGLADIQISLPSLLSMNDRAAASVGLENRCPYLDHRIVEFAFKLPPKMKIREGRTKYLLRQAARGLVPEEIISRHDKKGLVVPLDPWLSGPLADWAQKLESSLSNRIEWPPVKKRQAYDRTLYSRMCLELWFRIFFPDARR